MEDWVACLSELINTNTTVGSNQEEAAARLLARRFSLLPFERQIYLPAPGRGSFLARWQGEHHDTVLLLTHLDTAPYDCQSGTWRFPSDRVSVHPAFVGGRGALDCKGLIAVWYEVLCRLVERGQRPYRTILFAALADEEQGGALGAEWLLEQTDVFSDVSLVIGEGGGFPLQRGGRLYYTLQTEEGNACELPTTLDQTDLLARALNAGLYNNETITYLNAPVGEEKRQILRDTFFSALPPVLERYPGGKRCGAAKWIQTVQQSLRQTVPEATVLPVITPGFSDNRFFRARGIDTIGFFPLHPDNPIGGIHGKDECITRKSFALAADCLERLLFSIAFTGND